MSLLPASHVYRDMRHPDQCSEETTVHAVAPGLLLSLLQLALWSSDSFFVCHSFNVRTRMQQGGPFDTLSSVFSLFSML